MKIKCDDGKVRRFTIPVNAYTKENSYPHAIESKCLECGKEFGVHDTKLLKPEWKKHICGC
jgi:hypothetical protein